MLKYRILNGALLGIRDFGLPLAKFQQPRITVATINSRRTFLTSSSFFNSIAKQQKLVNGSKSDDEGSKNVNPLKQFLVDKIRLSGPITVAEYMQICVGSPGAGYYSKNDGQILGAKGDFITSPEFTQMLGELLGVWVVNEFFRLSHSDSWQLVELGPGSGNLMHDMLGVLRKFRLVDQNMDVRLVETSRQLIREQATVLCGDDDSFVVPHPNDPSNSKDTGVTCSKESLFGPTVHWHDTVDSVPGRFSVFVAHEFFDALPVHKFRRTEKGWREVLVGVHREDPQKLEYQLASGITVAQQMYLNKNLAESTTEDHLEVSPASARLFSLIADRINQFGGAALIIDYGSASAADRSNSGDTLRAFKNHKLVDPLIKPGRCDVTADVNFDHLLEPVKDKVCIFGPLDQKSFLENLGLQVRFDKLLQTAESDQERDYLKKSLLLLTDPSQMGRRFKAVAMFPKVIESILKESPPSGFCPLR